MGKCMKFRNLEMLVFAALFSIAHFGSAQAEEGGGNASDPTAAVNYTDLRFQAFDLYGDASGRERDRYAIEGAYIPADGHKFTYELNSKFENAFETFQFIETGHWGLATLNAISNLLICLFAVRWSRN